MTVGLDYVDENVLHCILLNVTQVMIKTDNNEKLIFRLTFENQPKNYQSL